MAGDKGVQGVCDIHLRVKDAGGRLDNAGQTAVSLDLEDLTLGIGKDSEQVDDDILGLHVQDKGERQRLGLSGGDLDIVADGRQVAKDTGAPRRIFRQGLGSGQHSTNEGKLDWSLLEVLHLDNCLCWVAVDKLDTKARIGEVCGDIDLQVGGLRTGVRSGLRILWLLSRNVRKI